MARRQVFLTARWSERWQVNYPSLPADRQSSCDRAVIALIKRRATPGLRIKPILPDKYYLEARISSGERIVFRVESDTIFFADVVPHDEIGVYGRRPITTR
jgi:hypothetical protein